LTCGGGFAALPGIILIRHFDVEISILVVLQANKSAEHVFRPFFFGRKELQLSPPAPQKKKVLKSILVGFQGEYVRAFRCSWAHEFCCTDVVLTRAFLRNYLRNRESLQS
jgi:hypothetical protein